jgi:Zn-dependent protease
MSSQSSQLKAFLEIPHINGIIVLIDGNNHIGKDSIRNSTKKSLDVSSLTPISRIKRDPKTNRITKEQFIIFKKNGQFYIEDQHSTNGTYLGEINLKQNPPQLLHDGSLIILPMDAKGKLTQLKVYFRIGNPDKKIKTSDSVVDPTLDATPDAFPAYQQSPRAIKKTTVQQSAKDDLDGPKYYDPTHQPTVQPASPNSSVNYPSQYSQLAGSSSKSFIIVQQPVQLPPDAFDPQVSHRFGLDLSMFYRLQWSEWTHIFIAYMLLAVLIYRTNMNVTLLLYGLKYGFGNIFDYSQEIFIDPIPTALIFGIVFITHELSHLYTGKSQGYPSRFCLLKKGLKITTIAAVIGLPFALPGAAVSLGINPDKDQDQMGKIKIAGPLSNLIFGAVCLVVGIILPNSLLIQSLFYQGATFNFSLGLFNMMPKEFGTFALDGKFIFTWKKPLFFILLAGLIGGYVICMIIIA